jgi:hypothetical protein
VEHLVRVGGKNLAVSRRLPRQDVKRQILQLCPLKATRKQAKKQMLTLAQSLEAEYRALLQPWQQPQRPARQPTPQEQQAQQFFMLGRGRRRGQQPRLVRQNAGPIYQPRAPVVQQQQQGQ